MILEMSLSDLWTCFLANSWMKNSRLKDLIQDIWKDVNGSFRHGRNNSSRRASILVKCGSARITIKPGLGHQTEDSIKKGGWVGVF
jgi:hypothetical protein